jgi:hypothetical protein
VSFRNDFATSKGPVNGTGGYMNDVPMHLPCSPPAIASTLRKTTQRMKMIVVFMFSGNAECFLA